MAHICSRTVRVSLAGVLNRSWCAGKASQAREMLQRALKSLPKRKHIETIVKFAILEFKLGDKERGETATSLKSTWLTHFSAHGV